jgi:2-amino-4-hydroxy-6-hydroxymethyldihydropteridine diphosphokinase
MQQVFLLLGSNQGDRADFLNKAIKALQSHGTIKSCSSRYETQAWGKSDQAAFLNQAIEIDTMLPPEDLLKTLLQIEETLGRKRLERYGPRTIDIDILMYADQIHRSASLIVPHPELPNRRFALTALAEIAAGKIHPVVQKTIGDLLDQCTDSLEVNRID